MDPLTLAAIAQIGGGIIGNELSRGDRNAAQDQIRAIQAMYDQIQLPDIEKQKLNLEGFEQGQMLTPEQQQVRELSMQDQLQNINLDPRLKETQNNALDILRQISGKGFTPDEKAAMDEQRSSREADLTSKLKSIQQQQDMRGAGNSDMALSQRMMEAQGSANRGAADARNMEAQAFRRSLDAISQGANLASGMENTDYNRQANLANAQRGRETTNLQNRINTEGSNVDRFNRALEANTGRLNTTSDKNVALRNDQQQFNKNLVNQGFNQQLSLANARAGAGRDTANMNNSNADRTAGMAAGIGRGIGSGILAAGAPSNKPTEKATYDKDGNLIL